MRQHSEDSCNLFPASSVLLNIGVTYKYSWLTFSWTVERFFFSSLWVNSDFINKCKFLHVSFYAHKKFSIPGFIWAIGESEDLERFFIAF